VFVRRAEIATGDHWDSQIMTRYLHKPLSRINTRDQQAVIQRSFLQFGCLARRSESLFLRRNFLKSTGLSQIPRQRPRVSSWTRASQPSPATREANKASRVSGTKLGHLCPRLLAALSLLGCFLRRCDRQIIEVKVKRKFWTANFQTL
jgi:hypothetical protein